jgi:hypothetical protein
MSAVGGRIGEGLFRRRNMGHGLQTIDSLPGAASRELSWRPRTSRSMPATRRCCCVVELLRPGARMLLVLYLPRPEIRDAASYFAGHAGGDAALQ